MIGKPNELVQWLFTQDREKLFEIKEHKEKRSLTSNSYAWQLLSKIADALRKSKEEVYLEYLKQYGQSEVVSVLEHIDVTGYFKYYEEIGTGTVNGKKFKHYRIIKGSSEYNTKEMAIFIDGIVEEAKQMDIETLPPAELERLKERWKA